MTCRCLPLTAMFLHIASHLWHAAACTEVAKQLLSRAPTSLSPYIAKPCRRSSSWLLTAAVKSFSPAQNSPSPLRPSTIPCACSFTELLRTALTCSRHPSPMKSATALVLTASTPPLSLQSTTPWPAHYGEPPFQPPFVSSSTCGLDAHKLDRLSIDAQISPEHYFAAVSTPLQPL